MLVWFLFGAMCLFVLLLGVAYWRFASLNSKTQAAWNKLDQLLKYRAEFIPGASLAAASLPELDREFSYKLSSLSIHGNSLQERASYEAQITQAFQKLFSALQAHPELSQEEYLTKLCNNIRQTENKIQRAKNKYNSLAHTFNTMAIIIPLNLIVQMFEMEPYEYFDFSLSQTR